MIDLPASSPRSAGFSGATAWLKQDSDKAFYANLAPRLHGLIVTANLVERSRESVTPFLRKFGRPFLIHPQLHRFQFVGHFRDADGRLNQNMARLGATYGEGTGLPLALEALRGEMVSIEAAERLAANILGFQRSLTTAETPLFGTTPLSSLGEAAPSGLIAPTLAYVHLDENYRASVRLARASSEITRGLAFLEICVDAELLRKVGAVEELASEFGSIPAGGYLLQLVGIDEVALACDPKLQARIASLVSRLAAKAPSVHLLGGGFAARLFHHAGVTGYAVALNPTNVHGRVTPFEGRSRKALRHYLAGAFQAVSYDDLTKSASRLSREAFHGPSGPCAACRAAGEGENELLIDLYTATEVKEGQRRRDPTRSAYGLNVFHYQFVARDEWDLVTSASLADIRGALISQKQQLEGVLPVNHLSGLIELANRLSRGIQLEVAIKLPGRSRSGAGSRETGRFAQP